MGYRPITYCPYCGEPNDVYMEPEYRWCSEECEAAAKAEAEYELSLDETHTDGERVPRKEDAP